MHHCWPIYSVSEAFTLYRPKAIDLAAIAPDGPFPVISEAGEIGRSQQNNHGPDDNILVSRGPNCGKISVLEEFAWLTGDLLVFRAKVGGVSSSYARHYFRWLLQRPELIIKGDVPTIDRRALLNQRFVKPDWATQMKICEQIEEMEAMGLGERYNRNGRSTFFRFRRE